MSAFSQEIAIKAFRLQVSDTVLKFLSTFDKGLVNDLGLFNLIYQLDPYQQTTITVNCVIAEVDDEHKTDERRQCGARASSRFVHDAHEPIESRPIP